jgi:hypothetical protein
MTTGLTTHAGSTVFDALVDALKGGSAYNRDDVVSPAAILWPKGKEKWESVGPRLRAVLLQFLTLGAYDKANRVGAAIWLGSVWLDMFRMSPHRLISSWPWKSHTWKGG